MLSPHVRGSLIKLAVGERSPDPSRTARDSPPPSPFPSLLSLTHPLLRNSETKSASSLFSSINPKLKSLSPFFISSSRSHSLLSHFVCLYALKRFCAVNC
ncbi:hypothetical protein VNO80_27281 [Phaseolus coccineus]|uniref:Uncharacterized protein n=1 Tax=Phaseolus coccineus TaxID=3886 RepID=A0AAN9LJQ4_PHACN